MPRPPPPTVDLPPRRLGTPRTQVNGKMRGAVEVEVGIGQDDAVATARTLPAVAKQLEGKEVKKVIFVAGKILNIIIGK